MIIFIDESGTHKDKDHSTISLVYVGVVSLELFERSVEEIEKELGIKNFHWTSERWVTREKFLNKILKLDFKLKIAILDNPISFNKSFEEVLKHLVVEEKVNKIIIDGEKPKWYVQRLKKVLRDMGVTVKKIKVVKDETSPGVRVSDCLAGLVRVHYDNPDSKASKMYNRLKKSNKIKIELTAYLS